MLIAYHAEHDDCDVSENDGPLGNFVQKLHSWKKGTYSMVVTAKQESILNDMEFKWILPTPFEKKLPLLRAYKEEHGNCNVPQKSGPLGEWVNKLRRRNRGSQKRQPKNDCNSTAGCNIA